MKKHRSLLILTGALAVLVIVYLGLGSLQSKTGTEGSRDR